MKHVPERHQSIAPPMSVVAIFAALAVVMAVIYVVVAAAS